MPRCPFDGATGSSSAGGGVLRSTVGTSEDLGQSSRPRRGSETGSPPSQPKIQPGNQDGVLRQIHHGARAERGHNLALPDLSLGFMSRSYAFPPRVRHFRASSRPRSRSVPHPASERLARNFMRRFFGREVLHIRAEEIVQQLLRGARFGRVVLQAHADLLVIPAPPLPTHRAGRCARSRTR